MIAIVDYGVGNIFSLCSSFARIGADVKLTGDPAEIRAADKLILPGVGAFGDAADKLRESGLGDVVVDEARRGKALMGICLGMQLLFDESYEYGRHRGLGLIEGRVVTMDQAATTAQTPETRAAATSGGAPIAAAAGFQPVQPNEAGAAATGGRQASDVHIVPAGLKVPHIGWNALHFPQGRPKSKIFDKISEGDFVYFVHTYHAIDCDASVIATTDYGIQLTAAVARGNVYGLQFHPEKSGDVGMKILKAFVEMEV